MLSLGLHDGTRAWKSFEWNVMARLHEKGSISDPRGTAKSVVFTELGPAEYDAYAVRTPMLIPRLWPAAKS